MQFAGNGKSAFYRLFGGVIEKGRLRSALCPCWDAVPADYREPMCGKFNESNFPQALNNLVPTYISGTHVAYDAAAADSGSGMCLIASC
jgi:hypothetical protein